MSNEAMPPFLSKLPFEFKWMKKIVELDPKAFPQCETKEKEFGVLRWKKIWYVHRYPNQWYVLQLYPELKSYKFE